MELDINTGNSLVDMYAKSGSLKEAHYVFHKLPERNAATLHTIITGYAEHGHNEEALQLFKEMMFEGIKPHNTLFVCILKVCSSIAELEHGKHVHANIVDQGLESYEFVGSTLMDMYIKCGSLENAQKVLDKLGVQDVVTWSTLIGGYAEYQDNEGAILLFKKMQEKNIEPNYVTFVCILKSCSGVAALDQGLLIHADVIRRGLDSYLVVGSTLIDMYAKCGSLDDALHVWIKLPSQNIVSWSAMITGYVEHGHGELALKLFEEMQEEGTLPDVVTFASALKGCSTIAALEQGNLIHADIVRQQFELDTFVGNTLVDMYGKCGSLDDACTVFDRLPVRGVVTWNAMISAYAEHGYCELAQQYFEQESIKPDAITFVCLLSACSHAGLMWEGFFFVKFMIEDHSLTPTIEHCVCMVDILGRAGCLIEAEYLVYKMPLQPTAILWLALLGSFAKYGDLERGRWGFDGLFQSDCRHATGHVLMSNIYAINNMWEDAEKFRDMKV